MIKYNNKTINDWNFDNDNIIKVYRNNAVRYQKVINGSTPVLPYNITGTTTSSSDFTITLNGVPTDATVYSDNGDGTYNWGIVTTSAITNTTNMCYDNTSLKSFDFYNADTSNLTSIGDVAFSGCTNLSSITIPDSVTSIGVRAFQNCSGLTSIAIPSGVTSIDLKAFQNCYGLSSVTIPDGITTISQDTFQNCIGLTSVTIPDSVTTLNQAAFRNCSSLPSITIPSGVTSIANYAFDLCSGLTSITVKATTPPTIGRNYVFTSTNNCPIYVPCESETAYKTAWSTYADRIQCFSPAPVSPTDLRYTGTTTANTEISLSCCTEPLCNELDAHDITQTSSSTGRLKTINVGDCIICIGTDAFTGETNLTTVVLPATITVIKDVMLYNCSSMQTLTVLATTPPDFYLTGGGSTDYCGLFAASNVYEVIPSGFKIKVPAASVSAYKSATVWSRYASYIEAI